MGLKTAVHQAAEKRWGKEGKGRKGVKFIDRLVNMREGDEWAVIGTTYKVRGDVTFVQEYLTCNISSSSRDSGSGSGRKY